MPIQIDFSIQIALCCQRDFPLSLYPTQHLQVLRREVLTKRLSKSSLYPDGESTHKVGHIFFNVFAEYRARTCDIMLVRHALSQLS